MEINGFILENPEKVRRVIEGTTGRTGEAVGGLGEDADPAAIIAQYDRLGGLITKGGEKVKTGCFWDVKARTAVKEPKVVFVYRVNGQEIEVPDGEALPLAVRAAKIADEAAEEAAEAAEAKKSTAKKRR